MAGRAHGDVGQSVAVEVVHGGGPPPRPVARTANWVRPEIVIRAEFAGWTGDGMVRQAAYKGFDLEKDPKAVRREGAMRVDQQG